jgi:trehalose 6-phosphate phosphatase
LIGGALRQTPFGLITDIDGTISKTAPTPRQAEVSPQCRHYLSALYHQLALVAAISGRPAGEVRNMVGVEGIVYIGNHGLERWVKGHPRLHEEVRDYPGIIKAVTRELAPLLSREGIIIEDKGATASIHYRLCREPQAARREIMTALGKSTHARGLRIIHERMEYNLRGGIYLGDDLTDIDAFRAVHAATHDLKFQGFAIGITSHEMPERLAREADFTLDGVEDVERFLKWLTGTAEKAS